MLEALKSHEALGAAATEVDNAKNALAEAAFSFTTTGKQDPEYPLLHATPFLRMFGLVECARLLLQQAELAHKNLIQLWEEKGISADDKEARHAFLEQHDDARYFEGKVHTAHFFVYQLLPEVKSLLASIQSNDRSALDIAL